MIKDLLLFGSTAIPFFIVSPPVSALYSSGILLQKSIKDIQKNSKNGSPLASYMHKAVYTLIGIACVSFVGNLFAIDFLTSITSIILGMAVSLLADKSEKFIINP